MSDLALPTAFGPISAIEQIGGVILEVDPYLDRTGTLREQFEAREDYGAFMRLMYPIYLDGWHVAELRDHLTAVKNGEITRLIVTMPPRHSKSMHVSESFPAWYLGHYPDRRVIAVSHTQDLAEKMSYRVRQKFADPNWPFSLVRISDDRGGVKQWDIEGSPTGGYVAVGVGGSPTGLGADLIIIDDPIRNQQDADSALVRERVWDWYNGTLYTRRQPGAAILVTACMTGDTEVTMGDGSIKLLRDIRPGDVVATYDHGRLSSSRVENWVNNGPDLVYEIRMNSGTVVRANGRHPFLVDTGDGLIWLRLRHLRPGDSLVRVAQSAAHTSRESLARGRDATSQRSARGIATGTTERFDGPLDTGLHRTTTSTRETHNSSVATASPSNSTTPCLPNRAGDVPSAGDRPTMGTGGLRTTERTLDSTLITIMPPGRFVDSCATGVISPSGIWTPRTVSGRRSRTSVDTTSHEENGEAQDRTGAGLHVFRSAAQGEAQSQAEDFSTEEIDEIVPVGVEDVFDVQIARTENFIANGLVSHNTRWHEDDLIGRLLQKAKEGGEQWEVLHLPAQLDDGTYLWPEFWSEAEYLKAKMASERVWLAQYQGRPTREGGNLLKEEWFGLTVPGEMYVAIIQAWDCAEKPGVSNDYSVCATIGVSTTGYDLLHIWRDRVEFPDLLQAAQDQMTWARSMYANVPYTLAIEDKSSGTQLIQTLRASTRIPVVDVPAATTDNKVQRVIRNTAIAKARKIRLPVGVSWRSDFMREMKGFPNEAHDDIVDAVFIGIDQATGADAMAATTVNYMDQAAQRGQTPHLGRRRPPPPVSPP